MHVHKIRNGALADTVITAARIHEESWNTFDKVYEVSIYQAVWNSHDDNDVRQPAYLLLYVAWNDALDWALENQARRQ